jgi:hypothetical protein
MLCFGYLPGGLLFNKIISARLMRLLILCSWIFPAHGRPDIVYGADGFVRIMIFEFQERAFIQKHATRPAIFTFTDAGFLYRKKTRRSPPDFSSQAIHRAFNVMQNI